VSCYRRRCRSASGYGQWDDIRNVFDIQQDIFRHRELKQNQDTQTSDDGADELNTDVDYDVRDLMNESGITNIN
jgi:hypothetical protein